MAVGDVALWPACDSQTGDILNHALLPRTSRLNRFLDLFVDDLTCPEFVVGIVLVKKRGPRTRGKGWKKSKS